MVSITLEQMTQVELLTERYLGELYIIFCYNILEERAVIFEITGLKMIIMK